MESEQSPATETARWFANEVRSHDAALRSYLHGAFPSMRTEVEDVIQESYLRTWKARAAQPIVSARAFLFRVARNLALDAVRHNQASPIDRVRHLEGLSVLEDKPDAAEAASRHERVCLLADAIAQLPGRCREIFILHKIKQFSRREVATQLGLSERTVEVQTARAVRRCAEYLRKCGVNGMFDDEAR
jgi:RNA polymerase sigma factor (sigma-70 family)